MKALGIALLASTIAVPAHADFYGSVFGAIGKSNVNNNFGGAFVGTSTTEPVRFGSYQLGGTVGYTFGNNFYGEGSLKLTKNEFSAADDHYSAGSIATLRFGMTNETYDVGAFLAYLETDTDNNATDEMTRYLIGVEGAWAMQPNFTIQGQIAGISGPDGNDGTGGDDGLHSGYYAQIGARLDLNENFAVTGFYSLAEGRFDEDDATVDSYGLRLDYDLPQDGLSAFFSVEVNAMEQTGENEKSTETRMLLGLSMAFGSGASNGPGRDGAPHRLARIASVESWVGHTGGGME